MNLEQALQILDQVTAQVQLTRQGHANVVEALRVLHAVVTKEKTQPAPTLGLVKPE